MAAFRISHVLMPTSRRLFSTGVKSAAIRVISTPHGDMSFFPIENDQSMFEEAIEFTGSCFEVDEPINSVLGDSKYIMRAYLFPKKDALLNSGLSFCARNSEGKMVGVFFGVGLVDYLKPASQIETPEPTGTDAPIMKPNWEEDLNGLLDSLHERSAPFYPKPDTSAMVALTGSVSPTVRGASILKVGLGIWGELARQRNYKYLIGETSSHYAYKALLSLGAKKLAGIEYALWKNHAGEIPFAGVPKPHTGISTMLMNL